MSTDSIQLELFAEAQPAQCRPKVVPIEGGRAIAARDVHTELGSAADLAPAECPDMAGFALLTWDDQGFVHSTIYTGPRNPYSPAILKEIAASAVSS